MFSALYLWFRKTAVSIVMALPRAILILIVPTRYWQTTERKVELYKKIEVRDFVLISLIASALLSLVSEQFTGEAFGTGLNTKPFESEIEWIVDFLISLPVVHIIVFAGRREFWRIDESSAMLAAPLAATQLLTSVASALSGIADVISHGSYSVYRINHALFLVFWALVLLSWRSYALGVWSVLGASRVRAIAGNAVAFLTVGQGWVFALMLLLMIANRIDCTVCADVLSSILQPR